MFQSVLILNEEINLQKMGRKGKTSTKADGCTAAKYNSSTKRESSIYFNKLSLFYYFYFILLSLFYLYFIIFIKLNKLSLFCKTASQPLCTGVIAAGRY